MFKSSVCRGLVFYFSFFFSEAPLSPCIKSESGWLVQALQEDCRSSFRADHARPWCFPIQDVEPRVKRNAVLKNTSVRLSGIYQAAYRNTRGMDPLPLQLGEPPKDFGLVAARWPLSLRRSSEPSNSTEACQCLLGCALLLLSDRLERLGWVRIARLSSAQIVCICVGVTATPAFPGWPAQDPA